MRKLVGPCLSMLVSVLIGCVSTETMTSSNIKPDVIAQAYSTICRTADNQCTSIAQFRIGDQSGPTLEFSEPRQVMINGKEAKFFNSSVSNQAFDVLSYLTVVPIFKLYKSGSYYYAAYGFESNHVFDFIDDAGRKRETHIEVRSFLPVSKTPNAIGDLDSFSFGLREGLVDGETLSCILTLNPGRVERSLYATAHAVDGRYRCDFTQMRSSDAKRKPSDVYRLQILRSVSMDHEDDLGRMVRTSATTELTVNGKFEG